MRDPAPENRLLDNRETTILIACAFTLQAIFLLSTMLWA
jgi:hypothetical protein